MNLTGGQFSSLLGLVAAQTLLYANCTKSQVSLYSRYRWLRTTRLSTRSTMTDYRTEIGLVWALHARSTGNVCLSCSVHVFSPLIQSCTVMLHLGMGFDVLCGTLLGRRTACLLRNLRRANDCAFSRSPHGAPRGDAPSLLSLELGAHGDLPKPASFCYSSAVLIEFTVTCIEPFISLVESLVPESLTYICVLFSSYPQPTETTSLLIVLSHR